EETVDVNVQQAGYASESRRSGQRTSKGSANRAITSRASTTLSKAPDSIRSIASATTPGHWDCSMLPSLNSADSTGVGAGARFGSGNDWSPEPMPVTHDVPCRLPNTTSGTTKRLKPSSASG